VAATEAEALDKDRSLADVVWLVVVTGLAVASSVATYHYVGDELLFDPDSIYVVVFAAPIGVLAVVDLLRPALRGGTLYRAGLGAAGGVVALIERDRLRLNFAFVTALLLYGAACAIALLEWRSRRSVQQRSS
jgi:hypothetical protein